ncbi:MAG TPA: chemotaxis-specific protein-glutamate methyltransferase CheB, partial [Rhodospirillales bacterium]|nr:chemotaxis-specific protein-glutamate methyltransferase CheB [Rhodospirillales bacterium]
MALTPLPPAVSGPGQQRPGSPLPGAHVVVDASRGDPIKVMVVDDSAVVRGLVIGMLSSDPQIDVAASLANGALAVDRLARTRDIEVIILDIEMPVMDGLTALGKLLAIDPTVQVVMASTLTQYNAKISLTALEKGAADYIPKPSSRQLGGSADFHRDLLAKVKALAARRRAIGGTLPPATTPLPAKPLPAKPLPAKPLPAKPLPAKPLPALAAKPAPVPAAAPSIVLRPSTRIRPDIIAVGCSTGGPQALTKMLKGLMAEALAQPVIITQHMPPMFTTILAEHLQRATGVRCAEAVCGEPLLGGRIYVAPGDCHLLVEPAAGGPRVRLTRDPPENFCRPSVDPRLRSLAVAYGQRAVAVILTGMGSDGL